ncbi:MAG: HD-GYP domain-containing protein [Magnetococcales bacterium]|nr:HD-GYP domain-containing protein [Magnetococcales bacterium]
MIKKISIDQLKPGMVIQSFVGNWPKETGQFFSRTIKNQTEISGLKSKGIKELFIQAGDKEAYGGASTAKDVEAALEAQLAALEEDDEEEEEEEILPDEPSSEPFSEEAFTKELAHAENLQTKANEIVAKALEAVQTGGKVDRVAVKDAVNHLRDSVMRQEQALVGLAMLKNKGNHLFSHSVNMSCLLMVFFKTLGFRGDKLATVGTAGMLHDLGMAKIPPNIIAKKGLLTPPERKLVQSHVEATLQQLESIPGITELELRIAAQHHERWDGSGYPRKLTGQTINREGQAATLVDTFEAITSQRPYRPKLDAHTALKRIMSWGKQAYDPKLTQQFVKCIGVYPIGTLVRLKNNLIGMVISNNGRHLLHPIIRVVMDQTGKRVTHGKWLNLADLQDQVGYHIKEIPTPGKKKINPLEQLSR